MGLAKFKERRFSDRKRLTGLLPGRLLLTASKVDVNGRPVDVSPSGLGIVVSKELEAGTEISLILREQTIRLQVAWGQRDFGKQDMFRYGLVTLDPEINLEEIFVSSGCLR